jgi:hypothetical protein
MQDDIVCTVGNLFIIYCYKVKKCKCDQVYLLFGRNESKCSEECSYEKIVSRITESDLEYYNRKNRCKVVYKHFLHLRNELFTANTRCSRPVIKIGDEGQYNTVCIQCKCDCQKILVKRYYDLLLIFKKLFGKVITLTKFEPLIRPRFSNNHLISDNFKCKCPFACEEN